MNTDNRHNRRRALTGNIQILPSLVAVIDWYSRKVLAHRLSNTLDASFCVEAMEEPLSATERPRRSTRTRERSLLRRRSPMRSKRTACVSPWTARVAGWTTCTWSVCGAASSRKKSTGAPTDTVTEARKGIADYLRYFNEERPHQGLDNRTPDDVFYKRKPLPKAA